MRPTSSAAISGEPVDVVDCETVDLQVPATSEIVLEGTVSVTETALRGADGRVLRLSDRPAAARRSRSFTSSAMTYRDRADPARGRGRRADRGEPHLLGPGHQRPGPLGAAAGRVSGVDVFLPVPERGPLAGRHGESRSLSGPDSCRKLVGKTWPRSCSVPGPAR